eukprot:TRINITY_DN15704_c0_g1_i3.p1 TRINITY_DN15704_c0_g1~~TRINITY_DN15704_c0_g1_i3.p1  ORF type:complete len:131 (-),score=17.49 TRINITY_DN15704_c0_g1_i3:20-412(-)
MCIRDRSTWDPTKEFVLAMAYLHGGFLLLLILDFFICLPGLFFFKEHSVCILIVALLYTAVNLTATLMSGTPVYPIITYKDLASYIFILLSLALLFGTFYAVECCTKSRRKRIIFDDISFTDPPLIPRLE